MNVYTAETYRAPHLRYYNVSREKYPRRENEMDSPSFEGFHDRLDLYRLNCKVTYGNKHQIQLTLR